MSVSGGAVAGSRVVIVGGGVIGVCCAYFLAKRGAHVLLLDRERIAAGASSGNAGVIAPGHLPLVKPGGLWSLLKTVVRPSSPLYVAPRLDFELWKWLLMLARRFHEQTAEAAMRALAPLARESLRLYGELVAGEGIECGFRASGYYEVWRGSSGAREAEQQVAFARRHGFSAEVLEPAEMLRRAPRLRGGLTCAVHHRDAATLDPYAFVTGLAERAGAARAKFQVAKVTELLLAGDRVRGVRTEQGDEIGADAVVVAAGAWSADLLRPLGFSLPLQPAKGYHSDLVDERSPHPFIPEALLLAERLVFVTPMGDRVRLAGTLEFSGLDLRIREGRWRQLARAAAEYCQGVEGTRSISRWCGLRPCLPDGLPAIGPVAEIAGLYLATGHAMAGMTLGPVTGRLIADWCLAGSRPSQPPALDPARFGRKAEDQYFGTEGST
ncbi:MAG: FAD-dependent oxidoreductase [Bryobacterales bacterium]|nr:FAD-dependent oxidoreductase [Bryobacteraceae bacterium]MDW8129190.1 FAD-dependent oxidoreductase [Bryobacterales bacterium]